jgi:CHAT domain-containing protein
VVILRLLLACLLLAGCNQAGGKRGAAQDPQAIAAGLNLVGETCFADLVGKEGEGQLYRLRCGSWEQPSARIYRVVEGQTRLKSLTEQGPWRTAIDQRMVCEAAERTQILQGVDTWLMNCKLRNGGWPSIAFAASAKGGIYLADGIPAALPAMEVTIGRLSGLLATAPTEAGSQSAALQRLVTQLSDRLFGSGDMQDYYRLLQLAKYHNIVRNHTDAEKAYRDAMAVHQRLLGADNPETGDAMVHLALSLSNQGRIKEADPLFDRAGKLVQGAADPLLRARFVSYKSMHLANQGQRVQAYELARRATAMRRQVQAEFGGLDTSLDQGLAGRSFGLATDRTVLSNSAVESAALDVAQSLLIEAALDVRDGRSAAAETARNEAIGYFRRSRVVPDWWPPNVVELETEIALARKDYRTAELASRRLLADWSKLYPKSRPEGVAQLTLGRVLALEGRTEEALALFRAGTKTIQGTAGGLRFNQLQIYLEIAQALAERKPELRQALHAEMFEAAQLVRSGVTSRSIALAAARLAAGDQKIGAVIREKQEAERERFRLQGEYNLVLSLPEDGKSQKELARLRAEIAAQDDMLKQLNEQVQAAATGYNQLIEAPTTAESIVKLLRPNEALMAILVGEQRSYVFVLRADGVTMATIEVPDADLTESVALIRAGTDAGDTGRLPRFNLAEAHKLYRQLFGPVAKALDGVEHLVVAPSRALASLPFGLLVTEPPPRVAGNDYRDVKWLQRNVALSLVPSVRAFLDLRGVVKASQATRPFIGFGDFLPAPAGAGAADACVEDRERLAGFSRLPATPNEIRTVAGLFGATDIVLGTDFTRKAVERPELGQYRVIYFATHALLPTELECRSQPALLVSLPQGSTNAEDGVLDAEAILDLKLDADLVVLSACNTAGPSGETGGESLSGLARAFFYAGARALLVSHWLVEDAATAQLMRETFGRLKAGGAGTAAALRAAQLDILDRAGKDLPVAWSHPLFWSAFTLVGDGARGS